MSLISKLLFKFQALINEQNKKLKFHQAKVKELRDREHQNVAPVENVVEAVIKPQKRKSRNIKTTMEIGIFKAAVLQMLKK